MRKMPFRRAAAALFLICLITFGFSGCAVRRRVIGRLAGKAPQPLLVADKATLAAIVRRQYDRIRDFSATVDMTPVLGSAEKNKLTEYKDVRAYILFRKPADIRIIGLYPVVRSKAFDMVSNGSEFKLYISAKNRFVVGRSAMEQPSRNKLENLRPEHFVDALMVRPLESIDRVLIENYTDEENAFYILSEVGEAPGGELTLLRTIWFDRTNLKIRRQMIFDGAGNILTDARYDKWDDFDNVPFARHIDISRPRDEYEVILDLVKMDINKGVSDDKFVLNQPEGSTLQVLGQPPAAAPPTPTPKAGKKTL